MADLARSADPLTLRNDACCRVVCADTAVDKPRYRYQGGRYRPRLTEIAALRDFIEWPAAEGRRRWRRG